MSATPAQWSGVDLMGRGGLKLNSKNQYLQISHSISHSTLWYQRFMYLAELLTNIINWISAFKEKIVTMFTDTERITET
jgi:hypothetical protein